MLTARGWWFLVVVVLLLVLGVMGLATYVVAPAVLAVSLLAWFAFEWALFHVRVHGAVSRLKLTRRVVQGGRDVPMVWAGLPVEVRVTVEHDGFARVPFAAIEDRVPQAADRADGENETAAELRPGEPVEVVYALKAPAPGVLRFEGVRVRVADLHGFFYARVFVPDGSEYLVLPPLTDDEGQHKATKRFNTLPPPGVHRLRRPGSGGELLELRDYRPGDPPKMIAWKASARRDRLITKEFESDVPVRCVLMLDTSEGMRLGPPGDTPLTRMAAVASGVAQAAAANRDLVGLTTFDEHAATGTNPARTKIHMINVLRRLAEVCALQPGTAAAAPEQLTRRAHPLAVELYPELMAKRVNSMPLARLWLPLLDRPWGWVVFWVILLSAPFATASIWGAYLVHQAEWLRPILGPLAAASRWWLGTMIEASVSATPRSWFWGLRLLIAVLLLNVLVFLPATLGFVFWFFYGIRGWFGERKRELTRRKQLAALFALEDGTGPNEVERLVHDDEAYGERVSRFLQAHQVRMPVPLYDDQGRFRFRCPGKAGALAGAIMRAVSRARDNELYVVLADLAELGDDLAPVVRAARLARARHHQVLVIVPWPADMPPPEDKKPAPADEPAADHPTDRLPREKPRRRDPRKRRPGGADRGGALLPVVREALTRQYHEAFRHLRRSLGRVGATVIRANEGDPVRLVLERLDRLRGVRSRR